MSSRKINIISSSEDDDNPCVKITDEKKRKRMISNRESARRSRMKKERHIEELNDQMVHLRSKSNGLLRKINEVGSGLMAIESENMILRVQSEELTRRLELLHDMLVSCTTSTCSYYDHHDDIVNHANIDHQHDHDHEFTKMMDNILQEPWLQNGFDQSQNVDGIYQC